MGQVATILDSMNFSLEVFILNLGWGNLHKKDKAYIVMNKVPYDVIQK